MLLSNLQSSPFIAKIKRESDERRSTLSQKLLERLHCNFSSRSICIVFKMGKYQELLEKINHLRLLGISRIL